MYTYGWNTCITWCNQRHHTTCMRHIWIDASHVNTCIKCSNLCVHIWTMHQMMQSTSSHHMQSTSSTQIQSQNISTIHQDQTRSICNHKTFNQHHNTSNQYHHATCYKHHPVQTSTLLRHRATSLQHISTAHYHKTSAQHIKTRPLRCAINIITTHEINIITTHTIRMITAHAINIITTHAINVISTHTIKIITAHDSFVWHTSWFICVTHLIDLLVWHTSRFMIVTQLVPIRNSWLTYWISWLTHTCISRRSHMRDMNLEYTTSQPIPPAVAFSKARSKARIQSW